MLAPVLTPMARLLRRRPQQSELNRILTALYGAGEQGIAVPDLTPGNGFLFQDSAGTTPVTAYEQPVGLILDRSKGLVQTTVYTNDGNTASGWVYSGGAGGSIAASGGKLVFTCATTLTALQDRLARYEITGLTTGQNYLVTASLQNISDGVGARLGIASPALAGDNTGTYVDTNSASLTPVQFIFTASSSTMYLRLIAKAGNSNAQIGVDDIRVATLPGNHIIQATSTKRPTLSARYNLLERTEEFDNSFWGRISTTVFANASTAPNGTNTADNLYPSSSGTDRIVWRSSGLSVSSGASFTLSVYAKANGIRYLYFGTLTGGTVTSLMPFFDLQTGAIGQVGTYFDSVSMENVGNGWYRCVATKNSSPASLYPVFGVADANNNSSVAANGTSGIFIWGADLRRTIDTIGQPAYQRVGASNDYDTAGFYPYLSFDGTDDSMYTPASIPFATVTSDGLARRNLLSNPTQFNDAVWVNTGMTVTANSTAAPDGTITAHMVIPTAVSSMHRLVQNPLVTARTLSVYAKANGYEKIGLKESQTTGDWAAFQLTGPGSVIAAQTGVTASIEALTNGWYRCIMTLSASVSAGLQVSGLSPAYTSGDVNTPFTGDGTSGCFLWGAQLETGSTATAFQNIGTDKMTVFAGVTKLSDAATGQLFELSTSAATNNGSFLATAPNGAAANYGFSSRGTSTTSSNPTTYASPISNVLTNTSDISAPSLVFRINGAQVGSSTFTQGTGNYGNYQLFLGARDNVSRFFNGRLYPFFIRGAATDATTIAQVEQYIRARMPVNF